MSTRLRPGGAVVAVFVAVALTLGLAVPAGAGSSDEQRFVSLANQVRASAGQPPLILDWRLSAVARQWAAQMAAAGNISHNPNVAGQVDLDWHTLGENVGVGPDVDTVHNALVNSPAHYANLVDGDYELVGMGVVRSSDGYVWVVQNFAQTRSRPAPAYQEPAYHEPFYEEPAYEEPAPAPGPRPERARPAPKPAPQTVEAPAPEPDVQPAPVGRASVNIEELGRLALGLELVRALDIRRDLGGAPGGDALGGDRAVPVLSGHGSTHSARSGR